MSTKLRIILTGSTGMVGEAVLLECLKSEKVAEILVINRRPCGYMHPKLKEIIHSDFLNLTPLKTELGGYNTCLFCLGVSSVGMKEDEYKLLTYTLTMHVASVLVGMNPDMTFSYISGAGTDSSEKGRMMWARVKGKTENDLRKLNFKQVYAFRPGMLKATKGQKFTLKYYKYFEWLYPIVKFILPGSACKISELGQAMINASYHGYTEQILEVKDIINCADIKE